MVCHDLGSPSALWQRLSTVPDEARRHAGATAHAGWAQRLCTLLTCREENPVSRQTGKSGNSIWTTDLDGQNARELVREVDLASPDGAFWSPDGKQIALILFNWELDEKGKRVLRHLENANFRIEIMDADGTN